MGPLTVIPQPSTSQLPNGLLQSLLPFSLPLQIYMDFNQGNSVTVRQRDTGILNKNNILLRLKTRWQSR
uniref:Uncharacterized protein n=1 Tax=Balaenoptera musculus TaxID=9771 RepID=A0A8C0HWY4_BALMU